MVVGAKSVWLVGNDFSPATLALVDRYAILAVGDKPTLEVVALHEQHLQLRLEERDRRARLRGVESGIPTPARARAHPLLRHLPGDSPIAKMRRAITVDHAEPVGLAYAGVPAGAPDVGGDLAEAVALVVKALQRLNRFFRPNHDEASRLAPTWNFWQNGQR
jgi:hypothetical protein